MASDYYTVQFAKPAYYILTWNWPLDSSQLSSAAQPEPVVRMPIIG